MLEVWLLVARNGTEVPDSLDVESFAAAVVWGIVHAPHLSEAYLSKLVVAVAVLAVHPMSPPGTADRHGNSHA